MNNHKTKFSSQANPALLGSLRAIASNEGKQFQSVLEEAMKYYIEYKRHERPRRHVLQALNESLIQYDDLYKKLAE